MSRSETVTGSEIERDARIVQIRAALDAAGHFEVGAVVDSEAAPASLVEGIEEFIRARVDAGKFKPKTGRTYGSYGLRVAEHLHAIHGIPEDEALPVTVLTRSSFAKMMLRDQVEGVSGTTKYAPLRFLLAVWKWMADAPEDWPQVPPPPHSPGDFLPRTPKYQRTVAPKLAHVDACLRRLPGKTSMATRMVGVFIRFTGLRSDTVLKIERQDVDLARKELHIREDIDKTEYARVLPLADELIAEAAAWIELTSEGRLFGKRRHARRDRSTPKKDPTPTYRLAWEAATEAGEVPQYVWHPRGRKYGRPVHAFRAALDAFLIGEGVGADVVDFLVGRNEPDVRARHHSRELVEEARRAVNLIPPVDWGPRH